MNIHPAFIHFPIALLTLYVIIEIVPFGKWYPKAAWEDIKTLLVATGGIGLLVALATGQLAEHSAFAEASKNILSVHKTFAGTTTAIFGIIAAAYVIHWIFEKHEASLGSLATDLAFLRAAANFVLKRWIIIPLALIGLATLTFTGALGGIIVYGPNADPVTKFVYSLFF